MSDEIDALARYANAAEQHARTVASLLEGLVAAVAEQESALGELQDDVAELRGEVASLGRVLSSRTDHLA